MNKREKKRFIRELMKNATKGMLEKVNSMPDKWDGIELRKFCADYVKTNFCWGTQNKQRMREYNNTVLVNNII